MGVKETKAKQQLAGKFVAIKTPLLEARRKQSLQPAKDMEPSSAPSVQATLDQRGNIYGSFAENSAVAIDILNIIFAANASRSVSLPKHELNALVMVAEKMSRVLTGKSHEDNWVDMAGYSELGRNPR